MAIEIKEISGRKEIKKFVCFPFPLYKGNPFWVPPLIFDEVNALDPRKNPSFEFCEAKLWMAYKDGRAVGRIAGIINHRANQIWNERNARLAGSILSMILKYLLRYLLRSKIGQKAWE